MRSGLARETNILTNHTLQCQGANGRGLTHIPARCSRSGNRGKNCKSTKPDNIQNVSASSQQSRDLPLGALPQTLFDSADCRVWHQVTRGRDGSSQAGWRASLSSLLMAEEEFEQNIQKEQTCTMLRVGFPSLLLLCSFFFPFLHSEIPNMYI